VNQHRRPPASGNAAGDAIADDGAAAFLAVRPRLLAIAHRMLGTMGDAEDVVQDAFLRFHAAGGTIDSPQAWLVTVTSRLAIDRLRAARRERAAYDGPWLPEPWTGPDDGDAFAGDLPYAVLVLMERLGPVERCAFVLRELIDMPYARLAEVLGRSEAACRQIVARARRRLGDGQIPAAPGDVLARRRRHERLMEEFRLALAAGDAERLIGLLAPDATITSDGGGKVLAARNIVRGAGRIVRLVLGVARKLGRGRIERPARFAGEAGFVTYDGERPVRIVMAASDGERITAVYFVLNPDKLVRIPTES